MSEALPAVRARMVAEDLDSFGATRQQFGGAAAANLQRRALTDQGLDLGALKQKAEAPNDAPAGIAAFFEVTDECNDRHLSGAAD